MTIIRQGSLFDLQELYDLEPTQRFEAIFSAIDIDQIFAVVTKKSRFGRPIELNYAAMIYSLVTRMSGIKMIAKEELGLLYDLEDPKAIELLKTLYFYLLNGGKLEQTMSDLALSMSGLRHRIKRIESLLEKDLRDPNEMHQLLLIIKSLIALGELDID